MRQRAAVALTRAWITEADARGLHAMLTGIQRAMAQRGKDGDRAAAGATVSFRVARSRAEAAEIKADADGVPLGVQ